MASECPNCHGVITDNSRCKQCEAEFFADNRPSKHHEWSWGDSFKLSESPRGGSFSLPSLSPFLQWLALPPAKDSTKFQVILKWVIRVLLWAIAPIAILVAIFVSIAPMLLVAFIVIALYACKVKD